MMPGTGHVYIKYFLNVDTSIKCKVGTNLSCVSCKL